MVARFPVFVFTLVAGATLVAKGQEMSIADATVIIRKEFQRLDSDGDRRITESEFLRRNDDRERLSRDFRLYDFDGSGFLSSTEFAAVSGLVEPSLRGRIPDPFDQLVAAAVAALDESYERWNQRPGELVNAHTFVANFLGSISPESKLFVTGRILRQADQDADGRLSRAEAKRFLQQQLGYHWYAGPPLREATGRLVRFDRFIDADADQSGSLTRDEYMQNRWGDAPTEADFKRLDRDRNGQIAYGEFAHPESNQYFDPIEFFRSADIDLDARLDANELFDASDAARRRMVASTFAGFDTNKDSLLTLQEYRLSPHANVNFSWYRKPVDINRDGRLSYDEFVFHSFDLFHLQRRYYFHRLDRDADGSLDHREFSFESGAPDSVLLGSLTREARQTLYRDSEFPHCGWPMLSPDGSTVLFHRQSPVKGQTTGRASQFEIVRVDVTSGESQVLADGRQPSWSRDGQRFVCLRNRDEVWTMSSLGVPLNHLGEGSSAKWSSDGRLIAILSDSSLWIYDVASGARRSLLVRDQHAYQNLGEDVVWSPDGQRLAIAARTTTHSEIVLIRLEDASSLIRHRTSKEGLISGPLSWSHQSGIVFLLQDRLQNSARILSLSADGEQPPKPIPWLDQAVRWKSACVSPDGMWYTAVSEE